MNGVTGPYCARLVSELGIPSESSQNNIPKEDFGGLHPDPNLKWAQHLIMSLRNLLEWENTRSNSFAQIHMKIKSQELQV